VVQHDLCVLDKSGSILAKLWIAERLEGVVCSTGRWLRTGYGAVNREELRRILNAENIRPTTYDLDG
jgi:hypothetical protein